MAVEYLDGWVARYITVPGMSISSSLLDGPFNMVLLGVLSLLLLTYVISFLDKVFLEWKL